MTEKKKHTSKGSQKNNNNTMNIIYTIVLILILLSLIPSIQLVNSHRHNVTVYCQTKEQILIGYRYNVSINESYIDENGTYVENFTYVNESYTYNYDVGFFGPPVANISIPLNCTPCLPMLPCARSSSGSIRSGWYTHSHPLS